MHIEYLIFEFDLYRSKFEYEDKKRYCKGLDN